MRTITNVNKHAYFMTKIAAINQNINNDGFVFYQVTAKGVCLLVLSLPFFVDMVCKQLF